MSEVTRREAIGTVSAGAAGLALAGAAAPAAAQEAVRRPPAFAGMHEIRPLGFDPSKLTGLSERLITSHWQNNYQGSVRALNMVEERLAAAMADPDLPPVIYGGLKREELHRTGSVILHEIYFDGLGGDGRPDGSVAEAIKTSHGSIDQWETEFRRSAMALAGGSGWCILSYNRHTGSLHNYWAWDHMHGAVSGEPLLALDMYEHSYHMDYGSNAAQYVDAFMRNVNWDACNRRFEAARRAYAALTA